MSQAEDFYASRPSSVAYNSTPVPDIHKPEPPPPPPPKPSSHELSRHGTPAQTGPPLPPLPSQGQSYSAQSSPITLTPQPPARPLPFQHPDTTLRSQPTVPPPSTSDNWVPGNLQDKVSTDLAPVLSNPSLLSALASSHPSYASSQAPLSTQISSNIASAERVQETATHLTQLREQTQALLLQHTNLSTQWRKKQGEMDKALEPWSPKALYQRLVASIAEQEAVVRAIEESFLDGGFHSAGPGSEDFYGIVSHGGATGSKASDREVGDWVKRIRDGVQTLEMRKEMRERWDEGRVGGWR